MAQAFDFVRKPRCLRTLPVLLLCLGMSMSALPPGSPDSSSSEEVEEWDWRICLPSDGTEPYVMALQRLGLDLGDAVPRKLRLAAITNADVEPTSDLIIGLFQKTPTKERLLNLRWL